MHNCIIHIVKFTTRNGVTRIKPHSTLLKFIIILMTMKIMQEGNCLMYATTLKFYFLLPVNRWGLLQDGDTGCGIFFVSIHNLRSLNLQSHSHGLSWISTPWSCDNDFTYKFKTFILELIYSLSKNFQHSIGTIIYLQCCLWELEVDCGWVWGFQAP